MSNSSERITSVALFSRSSVSLDIGVSSHDDGASAVSGADPQSGRTVTRHPGEARVRGLSSVLADGLRMAASYSPPRSPFLLADDQGAAPTNDGAGDDASVVVVLEEDWLTDGLRSFSPSLSVGSDADVEDENDEGGNSLSVGLSADDAETAVSGARRENASVPDALAAAIADAEGLSGAFRLVTPSPSLRDEDLEAEESDETEAGPSRNASSSPVVDGGASPSPSEDEYFDVVYADELAADVARVQPERGSLRAIRQARGQLASGHQATGQQAGRQQAAGPTSSAISDPSLLRAALDTVRVADLSQCGERNLGLYLRDVAAHYRLSGDGRNVIGNVLDRQYRMVQHRVAREERLDHNRAVVRDSLEREAIRTQGGIWPAIWAQADSNSE